MTARILVIEDDAMSRKMLKDVLHYLGYEVLEAKNGKEGIGMAREHMPQLIFMDIEMPVMGGVEAMKILKADPLTRDLKIIANTGQDVYADTREFRGAVFDDTISKPTTILQLTDMLKKHLC